MLKANVLAAFVAMLTATACSNQNARAKSTASQADSPLEINMQCKSEPADKNYFSLTYSNGILDLEEVWGNGEERDSDRLRDLSVKVRHGLQSMSQEGSSEEGLVGGFELEVSLESMEGSLRMTGTPGGNPGANVWVSCSEI